MEYLDNELYLKWCEYILEGYEPLFGVLALEAKWKLLNKYQQGY
jgi:hypothetical protein